MTTGVRQQQCMSFRDAMWQAGGNLAELKNQTFMDSQGNTFKIIPNLVTCDFDISLVSMKQKVEYGSLAKVHLTLSKFLDRRFNSKTHEAVQKHYRNKTVKAIKSRQKAEVMRSGFYICHDYTASTNFGRIGLKEHSSKKTSLSQLIEHAHGHGISANKMTKLVNDTEKLNSVSINKLPPMRCAFSDKSQPEILAPDNAVQLEVQLSAKNFFSSETSPSATVKRDALPETMNIAVSKNGFSKLLISSNIIKYNGYRIIIDPTDIISVKAISPENGEIYGCRVNGGFQRIKTRR